MSKKILLAFTLLSVFYCSGAETPGARCSDISLLPEDGMQSGVAICGGELLAPGPVGQSMRPRRVMESGRHLLESPSFLRASRQMPGAPGADDPFIGEKPDGEGCILVKTGMGYGYSMLDGLKMANADGSVMNMVVSADGTKVYLDNPFSQSETNGWLIGEVSGEYVTLTLPQVVSRTIYSYDDGMYQYDEYCMALEFIAADDDPSSGWYYPTEEQTYRFRMMDGGALVPDNPKLMLGKCVWAQSQEDPEVRTWRWMGVGDCASSLEPLEATVAEVPENTVFEDWNLFDDNLYYPVRVGFSDDKVYIKGLFVYGDGEEIADAPVVGVIADGKVKIDSRQYLGIDRRAAATAWFLSGYIVSEKDDDGQEYRVFRMSDDIVLDYDSDRKVLSSDDPYCISLSDKSVNMYEYKEYVYIAAPDPDAVVTALKDPVIYSYYAEIPEYGIPGQIMAWVPLMDADRNPLDTSKLYYNLIIDDEVFTFYPDEYIGLEEEMTDIPFGFDDEVNLDFYCLGITEAIAIYTTGYDSLGIRGVYKDGDRVVTSATVYAVNNSSAPAVDIDREAVSEVYYDLAGRRVTSPAGGIFIKKTLYDDGSVVCSKIVVK